MSSNQMPLDSEDDSSVRDGTSAGYVVDHDKIGELRAELEDAGHTYAKQRRPRNEEDALAFTLVGMLRDGLTKLFNQPGPVVESELDSLKHFFLSQFAKRRSHWIPQSESNLLLKINEPFPSEKQEKLLALVDKRDEAGLDDSERAELVALAEEIQGYEQSRLEALSRLATIRGVSLEELSEQVQLPSTRPK